MEKKVMDLSRLIKFMDETLESTEKSRLVIQKECDEAYFVMKPWIVDTLVTRQVEKKQCTCPQAQSLDDQAEELAASIEKALQQSQELQYLNNCPQHGDDNSINFITEKKKVAINFVEAFNRFGVPDDLLKILKFYQLFIGKIDEEKIEKKSNIFLEKLETYHDKQIANISENNIVHLVKGFNKLNYNLHNLPSKNVKINSLKNTFYELDNLSKFCSIKKYDTLKSERIEKQKNNNSISTGWLSNGFWNNSTIEYFPEFIKLNTINYKNINELLLLFNSIQQLQHINYQKKLIDIIINDIIPSINNFDNNSKEYINIYKMIFTIVQVLNPNLPTLVSN
ncbi:uncharacterized protein LOC122847822 [Aphidius gifuensis]|uniref:uncharacterized protein LOC122847822 n=1 Tax=Aphidius gifuensis TaxID=684658 RepID=UPI001CDD5F52|nr:uncharacterized protein LOC122847822 [Aphidius gifuensis]